MLETAEDRVKYRKTSVVCILAAVGMGVMFFSLARIHAGDDLTLVTFVAALISWFTGLGCYGRSKGYNIAVGMLLGLLNVIGLIVLLVLPATPVRPTYSVTNPPRPF